MQKKRASEFLKLLHCTLKNIYFPINSWKTWEKSIDLKSTSRHLMMKKSNLFHYLGKEYLKKLKSQEKGSPFSIFFITINGVSDVIFLSRGKLNKPYNCCLR